MKRMFLPFVAVALVVVGCAPRVSIQKPLAADGEVHEAPGFAIPLLGGTGGTLDLAAYKGSVVLLDFWATWCPPCRSELPELNKLYQDLKDQGFVLVGMTVDQGDAASVGKAVSRFDISYPLGLAGAEAQAAYGGIRAVPTKFLLDREGGIRKQYVGVVSEAQLRADIEALLSM